MQPTPGTQTHSCLDNPAYGAGFKSEIWFPQLMRLDRHVWSVMLLLNIELSPCLTPKLCKTKKAACTTPFPSAPPPIKPLTQQLRLIILKHKYWFYCSSWESRKSPWFFLVHSWVSVLYKVILTFYGISMCGFFHPKNKGIPTGLNAKRGQALSTELSEPQDVLLHLVCTS